MQLIDSHPALRHVPPHTGINPFTREPWEYNAPASTAQITVEGTRVGAIEWAMDGSRYLLVHAAEGRVDFVESVATDVATTLGACFVRIREGE
jgi:hypothetical protein